MAIQLLAGVPWLASIIGGVFTSLFVFFGQYLTKRLAIVVSIVALIATLTTSLFAALEALLSGLSYAFPPQVVAGMAMVTPDNLTTCASIIITAKMLRFAYDWNVKVLQYKLQF